MAYKIVLIFAVVLQIVAAVLALRLNYKYRSHSAWLMISAAAWLIAVLQTAMLLIIWNMNLQPQYIEDDSLLTNVMHEMQLWIGCLSALLVSVLFVGGMALIEPLFKDIAKAQRLLEQEKVELEEVVQETESELKVARHIQRSLLPKSAPEVPGFDMAGISVPAKWTGGDYFDYISQEPHTLWVVVADVSGHGLAPSLLMTATRSRLRALAQPDSDAGRILSLTNDAIAEESHGRFVTMWLAKIDLNARTFIYSSAGHDAVLLRADGESCVLKGKGPPLGVLAGHTYENSPPIELAAGDTLLLYSDGFPESESPQKEHFGIKRMLDVVRNHSAKPADEIVRVLLESTQEFHGRPAPKDDMTAVIVKAVE